MDFALPEEIADLQNGLQEWNANRLGGGAPRLFSVEQWRDFLKWDLFSDLQSDAELLAAAVAYREVARGGLPGPLLEADLAVAAGGADALEWLGKGAVVSSIGPPAVPGRPEIVGWGAAAEVVLDQTTGAVLAQGPLPQVQLAYPHPHGWLEERASAPADGDPLTLRRLVLASAIMSGLADGAHGLACRYAKEREQFGRSIGSFQAVQFPLARCKVFVDGMRLSAYDAAWRAATGRPGADVAAALAWTWAARSSPVITDCCHQTFGAAGLCNEFGLVELTWAMKWLRTSIATADAKALVLSQRALDRDNPPSLILRGCIQESS